MMSGVVYMKRTMNRFMHVSYKTSLQNSYLRPSSYRGRACCSTKLKCMCTFIHDYFWETDHVIPAHSICWHG